MNRRTLLAILIYLGLFWLAVAYAAFGQADTTHVSGVILKPDGKSPAIGAVIYALRSVRSGSVITSQSVEWKAGKDGIVHMTLPRNSTTYLYAPLVPSLNNPRGVAVIIPDASTATLAGLVPATTVPSGYVVAVPQVDTSASAFWNFSQPDTSGSAWWTGQAERYLHPAPRVWNVDLENPGELDSVYLHASPYDVINLTGGQTAAYMTTYPPSGKAFYLRFSSPPIALPGTGGNWQGSTFAYQYLISQQWGGDTLSDSDMSYSTIAGGNFVGAHLEFAVLKGAIVDGCDFSGAYINDVHAENLLAMEGNSALEFNGAYMAGASLSGSKLFAPNFASTSWGADTTQGGGRVDMCELYSPTFASAMLVGVSFIGTKFWFGSDAKAVAAWAGAFVNRCNFSGATGMPERTAFMAAVASYSPLTIWTDGLPITATRVIDSVATTPYNATMTAPILLVNTTAGAVTVNLPATALDGDIVTIRRTHGANSITVQATGQQINGATNHTIPDDVPVKFVRRGLGWWTI